MTFNASNFIAAILFAVGLFSITQNSHAVPASPDVVETTQPDGKKIRITLKGDEHFHWNETEDGYAIVKDKGDGFYKYAKPATDKAAFMPLDNARVGSTDPEKLGLKKNEKPSSKLIKAQRAKREATPSQAAPLADESTTSSETYPEPLINKIPISGTTTIKNVVILAAFSDHWDVGGATALATHARAPAEYNNLFNQANHTNDGAVGSVRDYYREVSYNKLTVDSLIVPWVQLPQNEAFYGANDVSGGDQAPRQMTLDAINAAEAAGFDFSQADADGDGWIDCLTIIHSGHGEEYGSNPDNSIWSHQWTLSSPVTRDGKQMYTYHTSPALRGLTSNSSIIRIGVICHEMGHFFGLPDLYDYSGDTNGVGNWCAMAGGSWNGNSFGNRPPHFSAWCKYMLGFVQPKQIDSENNIPIAGLATNPEVHLIRTGVSNKEYFLLENRVKTGFDNSTQIHPGIVIYHIDGKSTNNDLDAHAHPAVKIEEADGNDSLGLKITSSQAGDTWRSGTGLAGGFRDQTGNANTNAMMYQTGDYARANNPASYTYIELSNFSAAAATMTYNAKTLKSKVANQTAATNSYTVAWTPATNATLYELQEGEVQTATSFYDGAESEPAMYDNWHLGGDPVQSTTTNGALPAAGAAAYAMHYVWGGLWHAPVQSLTMKKTFLLKAATNLSFQTYSRSTGGTLRCQISNDNGTNWRNLAMYTGTSGWTNRTFSSAAMTATGVGLNDNCVIRFIMNQERAVGSSSWPGYGFALDAISITGTEMETLGNWITINNQLAAPNYAVFGNPNGDYAYQVRAFSNGNWQDYGPAGIVAVDSPATVSNDWTLFE